MKQELDTTENGQKKLKWSEKIAYGFGDFGNGFMFDLGQAYLTKFYTDIALIPAGMVGVIFSITKIFDAFMDPLAGSFVDTRKNHGKQGRFRPVMMFSSIILAILTIITFTMPNFSMTGKIAYAFATYMIWGVVYSFTNIPYGSLASVMTRDIDDRAHLATTRQAGSLGAQLVTGVAFIPIVMLFSEADGTINAHGYTIAAAVMALCGVLGFLVCFLGTREHIQINRSVNAEKEGIKDYGKSTHNRRECPVYGHRGGSRGRFYYRITTFEGRPWDAKDPHKTTFMTLKHAIRLSIWRKQKETPGVEKAPGVSSPQRKESGRSGRDDGELRFGYDPAIHARRLRVYHRPRRLRMALRISIILYSRRFSPANLMG